MKQRNIHASAPIMRKGGAHQKSKSAIRQADKAALKKEIQNNKATNGRLDCLWNNAFNFSLAK
jgi:hypothetical protein